MEGIENTKFHEGEDLGMGLRSVEKDGQKMLFNESGPVLEEPFVSLGSFGDTYPNVARAEKINGEVVYLNQDGIEVPFDDLEHLDEAA
jgi:hypothetical protein